MTKLSDLYITKDGRGVDYEGCSKSSAFRAYRIVAMELQQVDLSSLSQNESLSFWLNLYNALIIHANIVVGPPTNMFERAKFFGSIGYWIGGNKYTLSIIEHGILRNNRKPPSSFSKLLKKNDPRREFVIPSLDPRIHFALVCGAKSCPPIRIYSPDNIETALQWATEGFCFEEVDINVDKKSVTLSRIFQWYLKDFGSNIKQVLYWILNYLPEEKQNDLKYLLSTKIRIKYSTYDWDTNNRYTIEDEMNLTNEISSSNFSDLNKSKSSSSFNKTPEIGSRVCDGRGKIRSFSLQEWEIDFNEIELFEIIGKGGFSNVYRGMYKGNQVAVKRVPIESGISEKDSEIFLREVHTMRFVICFLILSMEH